MINKRKLRFEPEWCKGCGICVAFCPKHVLEIKENRVFAKQADDCILCGICEDRCPDYAVYIEEEDVDNLWVSSC